MEHVLAVPGPGGGAAPALAAPGGRAGRAGLARAGLLPAGPPPGQDRGRARAARVLEDEGAGTWLVGGGEGVM